MLTEYRSIAGRNAVDGFVLKLFIFRMLVDEWHLIQQLDVVLTVPWLIQFELIIQSLLLNEGEYMYSPAQKWLSISIFNIIFFPSGKILISEFVVIDGKPDLLHLVIALGFSGRTTSLSSGDSY